MNDATKIVKPPTFAALKNVSGFMELVKRLQKRLPGLPNIGVMHGPSGYGKSYASIYAQNKTRAVRIEVGESWNRKSFITAILREAGIAEPRGTLAVLFETAIMALGEEPNRPLIIDEADKLVAKGMIELVREIAEHSQVPVLLIGEELLPQELARTERVFNRVLGWYPAEACDLADARKLSDIFLPGVTIDDELLDSVRQQGQGRARRIVTTLWEMQEWARNHGAKELSLANYTGHIITGEAPSPRSGRLYAAPRSGRIS